MLPHGLSSSPSVVDSEGCYELESGKQLKPEKNEGQIVVTYKRVKKVDSI